MTMTSEPFEKLIAKGNFVHLQTQCKVLHEVKVYGKNGKLKKTISEKAIHRRHWMIAELESKNRLTGGFSNARTRKIQKSLAVEQFEDEELPGM